MKICTREDCSHGDLPQPDENFYKNSSSRGGRAAECKTCILERNRAHHKKNPDRKAEHHLKCKYGLTLADYDRMCAEQDGKCAICGTEAPGGPKLAKRFSVDHDHETGKVRALLCGHCNTGLGKFSDDPAVLRAALDYLEKHT